MLRNLAGLMAKHERSVDRLYALLGIVVASLRVQDLEHQANRLADLLAQVSGNESPRPS